MPKTKLYNLFRGAYSSEVPTITQNGTNIDVSSFLKINVNVPQGQGPSDSSIKVTLDEFVTICTNRSYENNTLYKIIIN